MAKKSSIRRNFSLARLAELTPTNRQKLGLEVRSMVRERAFPSEGAGRDEEGKTYKPYSTRRIYVSKSSPPRPADMPAPQGLTPAGAVRAAAKGKLRDRGLTRKDRKTVRYDQGYSQYRASIGR